MPPSELFPYRHNSLSSLETCYDESKGGFLMHGFLFQLIGILGILQVIATFILTCIAIYLLIVLIRYVQRHYQSLQ